jgi:hypothetical protein
MRYANDIRDFWARPSTPVRFYPVPFIAFAVIAFLINYPGRLNSDSFDQLLQASDPARLSDWHAPVVTWLWSIGGTVSGQPAAALAVQTLACAFFVSVLPAFKHTNMKTAVTLGCEAIFRLAMIGLAGVIIKDIALSIMILSMLACLQLAQSSQRKIRYLVVAAALLVLSLLVRPTNFLMFIIAWALISIMIFRTWREYSASLLLVVLAMLTVVPTTNLVNRALLGAHDSHAEKQLIIFDVAGISLRTGHNDFTTWSGWPRSGLPDPASCYWARKWDPFADYGQCAGYARTFDKVSDMRLRGAVGWWVTEIARHPVAYARHRLAYAYKMIFDPNAFIVDGRQVGIVNSVEGTAKRNYHFHGRPGVADLAFWRDNVSAIPLLKLTETLFAQEVSFGMAFLICLAILAVNVRKHLTGGHIDPIIVIATALGIGNVGMLMFFGVASEGRYLLPTTCCGYFALLTALRAWAAPSADQGAVQMGYNDISDPVPTGVKESR